MNNESSNTQKTGFYFNTNKQLIGPSGAINIFLDEDLYLIKNNKRINVYIDGDLFFKANKFLFFFKSFCPTGHSLNSEGEILGDTKNLPWEQLVK